MPIEPDLKKRHQGEKYARFEGVGQGWGRRIDAIRFQRNGIAPFAPVAFNSHLRSERG